MPGTDMCIKIGGWVRAEVSWGVNGNSTTGSFASDYNNRYTNNFWTRERGYITADAREQTAYGVARGYIAVGVSSQNQGNEVPAAQASINRAFVQWAGFTAGQSVSFFDFYPAAAQLYRAGNLPRKTPATAAGGCGAIPLSSAVASPPLCPPKSVVTARISTSAARLARWAA